MDNIICINGYRYFSIKKDSDIHHALIDLIRFVVLKKLSNEEVDSKFTSKEYIFLREKKSKKSKFYDELEILKELGIFLYVRYDSYRDTSIYTITEKCRDILKELQNIEEVQLIF